MIAKFKRFKNFWQFFKPLSKPPCTGDIVQITSVNNFKIIKDTSGIIGFPTFEAVYEGSTKKVLLIQYGVVLKIMSNEIRKEYWKNEKIIAKINKKSTMNERLSVYASKVKDGFIRHCTLSIEQVLPVLKCRNVKTTTSRLMDHDGIKIKVHDRKNRCFKKSVNCCSCGLEGKFFAVEKPKDSKQEFFKFNLYGVDEFNNEVMMTCDHIIPVSKGGSSANENVQTLCWKCNSLKGNKMEGEKI